MHNLLPAILEQDFAEIEKKLQKVKPFASHIHIDLLDGKFANNTTFLDPKPFARYSEEFFIEVHMMVEEPEAHLEQWAQAGIKRFIGHVEKMSSQTSFVARAQQLGEVGLALDAPTGIEALDVSLQDLDTLLVMTVKAGFSKQTFDPHCLHKVSSLHESLIPIEVDGGVNQETLPLALQAGASRAAITSALFSHDDALEATYESLASLFTTSPAERESYS